MLPGVCMLSLEALGVSSILLTSGTLSPMESFAHELVRALRCRRIACTLTARRPIASQQLNFPVRLENPHVISPSQARRAARGGAR